VLLACRFSLLNGHIADADRKKGERDSRYGNQNKDAHSKI
jgi:hypothetical protein